MTGHGKDKHTVQKPICDHAADPTITCDKCVESGNIAMNDESRTDVHGNEHESFVHKSVHGMKKAWTKVASGETVVNVASGIMYALTKV